MQDKANPAGSRAVSLHGYDRECLTAVRAGLKPAPTGGSGAQNKANPSWQTSGWRGRPAEPALVCKTKPIRGEAPQDGGAIVQNKANLREAKGVLTAGQKGGYGRVRRLCGDEEQSQSGGQGLGIAD